MSDLIGVDRDDELVRALLSPLERVEPVSLPPQRSHRRQSLVTVASGTAIVVACVLALFAVVGAVRDRLSTAHTALPVAEAANFRSCQLIGLQASYAAGAFQRAGMEVEWRVANNDGQISSTTSPTVAANSIVLEVVRDQHTPSKVLVFVQSLADASKPQSVRSMCPRPS